MLQKLWKYLNKDVKDVGKDIHKNILQPIWNTLTKEDSKIQNRAESSLGIPHHEADRLWHNHNSFMPPKIKKNYQMIEQFHNSLPTQLQNKLNINHSMSDNSKLVNQGQTTIIPHSTPEHPHDIAARNLANNAFGNRRITANNDKILESLKHEANMSNIRYLEDWGNRDPKNNSSLENWAKSHLTEIYKRHFSLSHPDIDPHKTMLNAINQHIQSLKDNPITRRILKQLITKMHPSVFGLDKRIGFKP